MKVLLATLMITALPATASAEPVQVSRAVVTADLDLSSSAGQRTLDRRLAIAIDEVCGTASNADLAGRNDVRTCRADAWVKVRADREQQIAARAPGLIRVGR